MRDATAERWQDVVAVMGTKGEAARCWCQWFHHPGQEFRATSLDGRRRDLQRQLDGSPPPGVVSYAADGTATGWCAAAPKRSYARLDTMRVARATDDTDGVWSVTCFVVRVGHRRRGHAEVLLDGAMDLARRHGATVVEAYAVDTTIRRASSAELFWGPLPLFLRAGFVEVARPALARAVVRRAVGP